MSQSEFDDRAEGLVQNASSRVLSSHQVTRLLSSADSRLISVDVVIYHPHFDPYRMDVPVLTERMYQFPVAVS